MISWIAWRSATTRGDRGWLFWRREKAKASSDAASYELTAETKATEAGVLKGRLAELKKAKPRDEAEIQETEVRHSALLKQSREAANKAEAIENTVYDLKAVNPHRKAEVDTRARTKLLELIEEK